MSGDVRRYIGECAKRSFWTSWDSANNLAGAILVGLAMSIHGAMHVFSGATALAKYANDTLSLVIYTVIAWIFLLLLRAVSVAPYSLWKEQRSRISALQNDTAALRDSNSHADAIRGQTEEMRLARQLQRYNSDPAIRAFQDARTEAIKSGQAIQEQTLGMAILWMAVSSAWGRWQAAHARQSVGVENRYLRDIAASHLLTLLEQGQLASRGLRSSVGEGEWEFISTDWWGKVHMVLVPDNFQVYKASIRLRPTLDAVVDDYAVILCDWSKLQAMFPREDKDIDAATAAFLSASES
jgi:hypothetical protein